jgi:hypothetical protein
VVGRPQCPLGVIFATRGGQGGIFGCPLGCDMLWYASLFITPHLQPTLSTRYLGIVIGLFVRCMYALFHPTNRIKDAIRWRPVIFTAVMFLFVTLYNATFLVIQSLSYINRRNFPGTPTTPPGPIGYYQFLAESNPVYIVADAMFLLNTALSDGLLVSSISPANSNSSA